jgi:hypothetical protein
LGAERLVGQNLKAQLLGVELDDYVLDVPMRDLAGNDHAPSAHFVYLHLWSQTVGRRVKTARPPSAGSSRPGSSASDASFVTQGSQRIYARGPQRR